MLTIEGTREGVTSARAMVIDVLTSWTVTNTLEGKEKGKQDKEIRQKVENGLNEKLTVVKEAVQHSSDQTEGHAAAQQGGKGAAPTSGAHFEIVHCGEDRIEMHVSVAAAAMIVSCRVCMSSALLFQAFLVRFDQKVSNRQLATRFGPDHWFQPTYGNLK